MLDGPKRKGSEETVAQQKFKWLRTMLRDASVSATAYRVACLLMWEYRNEEKGGECYPGLDTLAGDLGVNEKTIRRAIKELSDKKYLKVERRGKMKSNFYWPIFSDRTYLSKVNGHFCPKCPDKNVRGIMATESCLLNHEGGSQPPDHDHRTQSSTIRDRKALSSTISHGSEDRSSPFEGSPLHQASDSDDLENRGYCTRYRVGGTIEYENMLFTIDEIEYFDLYVTDHDGERAVIRLDDDTEEPFTVFWPGHDGAAYRGDNPSSDEEIPF